MDSYNSFYLFVGPICESQAPPDPCEDEPCENGGKCRVDKDGQFVCECTAGYSGPLCQEYDPCVSTPCNNGGMIFCLMRIWCLCRCIPNSENTL